MATYSLSYSERKIFQLSGRHTIDTSIMSGRGVAITNIDKLQGVVVTLINLTWMIWLHSVDSFRKFFVICFILTLSGNFFTGVCYRKSLRQWYLLSYFIIHIELAQTPPDCQPHPPENDNCNYNFLPQTKLEQQTICNCNFVMKTSVASWNCD